MRVTVVSPYHGGSHAAWARGLRDHSRHEVSLLTLPARFWKWRMHGGALTLARRYLDGAPADRLLVTDMLDLSTFLALTRSRTASTPVVLYMHENQLTYPLPEGSERGAMRRQGGERDRHYGFVNLASMLAANAVAFNSSFHREAVLGALSPFLRHFPERRELGSVEIIAARSTVLYPGIEVRDLPAASGSRPAPPLILWNQRWEYDKNPAPFCSALEALAAAGETFRVAICGQQFGRRPAELERVIERLGNHVVHIGHLERDAYVRLLGEAAIVVSTALHEFFGIAVLEAIAAGAMPLLPRRLAYPELIPAAFHERVLYEADEELVPRLRALLRDCGARATAVDLATAVRSEFAWERRVSALDEAIAAPPG